jgi:AcrR family transcriptional regulator
MSSEGRDRPGAAAIRRRNRGPSAAAANRAALVRAAREVFATAGYDAPLSAVAKRAGVGQGSLYRHFPDRLSLALAAFEENVNDLERLVDRPESTLDDCMDLLTDQVLAAAAYVDMLSGRTDDPRVATLAERVTEALSRKLSEAQRARRYGDHVRPGDLLMAIGMLSAVVARTPAAERRETTDRAWALLRRALAP